MEPIFFNKSVSNASNFYDVSTSTFSSNQFNHRNYLSYFEQRKPWTSPCSLKSNEQFLSDPKTISLPSSVIFFPKLYEKVSHHQLLLNQAKPSMLIFHSRYQGQSAQLALTLSAANESEPSRLRRKSRRL